MKKLLLLSLLLISFTATSQTYIDLSNVTEDIRLGQNCSNSQSSETFIAYDVNINDAEIELRNSILIIIGDVYSNDGDIDGCGQSSICIQGNVYGDFEYEDVEYDCSTLSIESFEPDNLYFINYQDKKIHVVDSKFITIINILGQTIHTTQEDILDFTFIPDGIYFLKTDKLIKKIIIK